eukprot:Rhum_TRINITY_DN9906_c0_g1::Rhum_TRINITY_DN9906_c0_g1_i1::g.35878::m.35878/K01148/PARN, PNLDC1; poly(A)-specific ribonuclease
MNVDTDNFAEGLEALRASLNDCQYVAMDLEMTGISLSGDARTAVSITDTPQQRYVKYKVAVEKFAPMQVGLACFKETQEGTLAAAPFNVYVFPRSIEDGSLGAPHIPQVSLCSSAMSFHRGNGFDFQRWVDKGVPYVTSAVESRLRREYELYVSRLEADATRRHRLAACLEAFESPVPPPATAENVNQYFANPAVAEAERMAKEEKEAEKPSKRKQGDGSSTYCITLTKETDIENVVATLNQVAAFAAGSEKQLKLARMNSFLARAVIERVKLMWPRLTLSSTRFGDQSWMVDRTLLRLTAEEADAHDEELKAVRRAKLEGQLGFRNMWNAVVQAGKRIVVHNGLLDLLFLFHFFEAALPSSLAEFKAIAVTTLDQNGVSVVDSKLLAEAYKPQLKSIVSTGLSDLFDTFDGSGDLCSVDLSARECFRRYTTPAEEGDTSPYHEAGFDALQTGRVYNHILSQTSTEAAEGVLPEYLNAVNMNRSFFRLSLDKRPDACTVGGFARLLQDLPKDIKENHLRQLFAGFCKEHTVGSRELNVYWSCDTALLLVLRPAALCDPLPSDPALFTEAQKEFSAALSQFLEEQPWTVSLWPEPGVSGASHALPRTPSENIPGVATHSGAVSADAPDVKKRRVN